MQSELSSSEVRLDALTSVRFFLAMMVVIGHFAGRFPALNVFPQFVYGMAPLAVGWFFMLSGYIIAYNYPSLKTIGERGRFLTLRVARLWPVHAVVLTTALLLDLYYPYRPWLIYQYTMTQAWSLSADIAASYNGPSWSISNEFFFYIVYIGMAAPQRWLGAVVGMVVVLAGIWIPLSKGCYGELSGMGDCNYWASMFPPARLIEFIAGIVLFRMKLRVPQMLGLMLAALAFGLTFPPQLPMEAVYVVRETILIVGGGALIASLARDGWLSDILRARLLVIGGEISYSIYMTHEIINHALVPLLKGFTPGAVFIATTSATLIVSSLLFYLVEGPSRNFVKRLIKRRAPLPIADITFRDASSNLIKAAHVKHVGAETA